VRVSGLRRRNGTANDRGWRPSYLELHNGVLACGSRQRSALVVALPLAEYPHRVPRPGWSGIRKEFVVVEVRAFHVGDAPRVAEIIRRCLREVNARDYSADTIERMCAHFSAERIVQLSGQRHIYVAEADAIVGTVSRDGNKVYTMFVEPDLAGQGIGRLLMCHIEAIAAAEGHDHMETGASITAHDFYRRLGYIDVRETDTDFGLNYILRKPLS
jgi:GNAT superfamily N-acetyltransferase